MIWHDLLNLYIVFIFSGFTLYIYYLFIYLFIYLFTYLSIRGPTLQKGEGSLFGRIFNPGMLRVEGVSSTQTYIYNP